MIENDTDFDFLFDDDSDNKPVSSEKEINPFKEEKKRKAGRPKGSKNKPSKEISAEEFVAMIEGGDVGASLPKFQEAAFKVTEENLLESAEAFASLSEEASRVSKILKDFAGFVKVYNNKNATENTE